MSKNKTLSATKSAEDGYAYDRICILLASTSSLVTNTYSANSLNQYVFIQEDSALSAPLREITYDLDGTHRYFYDGRLLIRETVTDLSTFQPFNFSTDYVWGKDLSGTLQGAGGIGGLLYLIVSNSNFQLQRYIPFYDNNGNITHYCDAQGNIVAQYTYDAFGNLLSATGSMADDFAFRFSTKYFAPETGLYYYGYRYYSPPLMRWLNRDPIEEKRGVNLYAMCGNNPQVYVDALGTDVFVIDMLPGQAPASGWENPLDNAAAELQYSRHINLRIRQIAKDCYLLKIDFKPPNTLFFIYYRNVKDPIHRVQELEHVDCHKRHYETALDAIYKKYNNTIYDLEKVKEISEEIEANLEAAWSNVKACNDALDAPGGPHGH